MLKWIKKHGGVLYIMVATLAVVIILACSNEMPAVLRSLGSLNARWIWGAIACVVAYLLARASTLTYYLRREGARIRFWQALIVTGVGQFYSAITPSASGGQPMQVIAMHRMGVPTSIATACVSIKFIGFQLAFMVLGGVLWSVQPRMVAAQLSGIRWLVALGYLINLVLLVAVALTMRRSRFVDGALLFLVRLGVKMHLVKDEERTTARARAVLKDYRAAFSRLISQPLDALVVLGLSILQVVTLMSVIWCIYHAFGLSGFSDIELTTLQLLLFIAAAFVPLPGAAGAQEGGFFLFFRNIFPESEIMAAMLCWRFFTYYLLMLSGMVGVIADSVYGLVLERKERKDDI